MKRQAINKGIFALPYAVICVLFVVFPLLLVLVYAFRGDDGSFTFDNFIWVFSNSANWLSLLRTVGISLLATAICLLIAYPVAYILASAPFNKIAILALLFVVPMWMNFMLRMFALQSILSMIGIANSFWAAIIGLVYDFFPFMLLPIYTALCNLDKSYAEAASDLGANGAVSFFKTTLPLSVPGIVSGVTMVFMPCFSSYAITDILGNPQTTVIGGKIDFLFYQYEWGAGSALSFVLLVLVMLTMFVGQLVTKRRSKGAQTVGGGSI